VSPPVYFDSAFLLGLLGGSCLRFEQSNRAQRIRDFKLMTESHYRHRGFGVTELVTRNIFLSGSSDGSVPSRFAALHRTDGPKPETVATGHQTREPCR